MSFLDTIVHGGATLGGTAFDYLTPGKGSSRLTNFGAGVSQPPRPQAPAGPNYGGASSGSSSLGGFSIPPAIAPSYNTTPVPRLADFNISNAYAKANQAAQRAINPVYAAELSRFVAGQQQKLTEQQQSSTYGKSALDLALGRLQQDNALSKERTTQDTNTNLADINATQAANSRAEGLSFDTANRALNEHLGATNTATSGLGQQQVQEGQKAFAAQSNEEVRQTNNKVLAAHTLMNRTFQDLNTGETRATADTATKKTQIDVDMQNFIKNQQLQLQSEKAQEEGAKQSDIINATIHKQSSQVQQWIASLSGKGYTPQEVALAAQVYG